MTYPQNEPQEWAPDLLVALIAGQPITGDLSLYAQWARSGFDPSAYLNPGSSANWQHMIGACLLWMEPTFPVNGSGLPFPATNVLEWWLGLLQAQTGEIPTDTTMFQYFGLSEPLSCIYEQMRWGSVLAVRLLALRSPDNPQSPDLLTWTARYSEILCGLLALGAAAWTAQDALVNSVDKGDVFQGWYTGPTISPVSERSEALGLETDLGPLWCMATEGSTAVSKRQQWPADIGQQVLAADPAGRFGNGAGFQAALDLVQEGGASALAAVIENLAGIRFWSPQYWLTWPADGLLVYKTEHLNGNTPCIFWSWSDFKAKSINLGWPWPPGRNREQSPPCQCGIQGSQIVAIVHEKDAVLAVLDLPSGSPSLSVVADTTGIRQST